VRSSPLGAVTVCKARSSFADGDALFTQGLVAVSVMQPIICCVRARSLHASL
jgi:hypothetical protein